MWQPIKTAPKDGSAFLAYGEENIAAVYWEDDFDGWQVYGAETYISEEFWLSFKPTHWMPLPPPPEA